MEITHAPIVAHESTGRLFILQHAPHSLDSLVNTLVGNGKADADKPLAIWAIAAARRYRHMRFV
jgi:hypothetical protein